MSKLILTTHAKERMLQRRINNGMIEQTLKKPQGKELEGDGDTQFFKKIEGRELHVVAKPIEHGDWLIKTVWVKDEKDPHPILKLFSMLFVRLFWR